MLSALSLVALAVIGGALILAWSKRFLAVGALALANLLVFVMTALGPRVVSRCSPRPHLSPVIHEELGFCAQNLYDARPMAALQLVTSMFVHADLMHLVGNLIILLAFALVFEELIGHRKFVVIYLLTGLLAAASQIAVSWGQPMLLMGASGAVFGIIGAFAGAYPNMVMRLPVPIFIIVFVRMRVFTAAIVFALIQIVLQTLSAASGLMGNVAYAAHLGGLTAGFFLAWALIRPDETKDTHIKVDLADLQRFATDASTRRAFDEMQANRDEPEVFRAWFERFWEGARDPESQQRVRPGPRGTVIREDGTRLPVKGDQTAPLRS